jgi:hypothetical protein
VQRGPDRISVLEPRGLLEGLVGEVSAKYGRQNRCNSSVVLNVAYGWTGQQSGSVFSDMPRPTLRVFASLDRF